MDNPWATAWENPDHLSEKQTEPSTSTWSSAAEQEADIGLPSWSAASTSQWTATSVPTGTIWPDIHSDTNAWDPSPPDDHSLQHREVSSEQDITAYHQPDVSKRPTSSSTDDATPPVSDHQLAPSLPPTRNSIDLVPETVDVITGSSELVSRVPEHEEEPDAWADATVLSPVNNDWGGAWSATPSADSKQEETQPPDEWQTALQEKEKLNRAVPPQLLESILRHCQQVSDEIWPPPGTANTDNWRTGFDDFQDIARLLAQVLPGDALPPPVQFSGTATAKAMNEALKLTRLMPMSARSPLSRLLASRGSTDWEKSIKSKQDTAPDPASVGWRVLEKEDRTSEGSKPKTATSSLLSFWNRRISAVVTAPAETSKERSMSPTRSSLDSVKSDSPAAASRAASPSRPPTSSVLAPPSTDAKAAVAATTSAPSAVSRFFNRFSRGKTAQQSSLALSSNDLEFLSDIVPSASDPDDEHVDDSALEAFSVVTKSSLIPPKLPSPIPPPPKSSTGQSRSSSVGLGILDAGNVLTPPLSPKPSSSFACAQSPALPPKDLTSVNISRLATSSIPQNLSLGSQPNSRPHSPFTLPPPPKAPAPLSIPPLLPPPPVSPPQTPRPSAVPSTTMPRASFTMQTTKAPAFYDSHDSDNEFSEFSSFPPAPFPSMGTYPQRSPSPPSPPPRRTYERTHYPSTSSTSSVLSPSSQNSGDRLRSARSSISASLDSFGDFVSPSAAEGGSGKRTPSPPPIPAKAHGQSQRQQPSRIDTFPSRVYHAHTSSHTFASPTVHTGLMSNTFSPTTVSDAEHQRTRHLVNHAAENGGLLWPNSPESPAEPMMRAIPPPPSSSMSPRSLIGDDSVDLLGDGDIFTSAAQALPAPLASGLGGSGIPTRSSVTSPVMNAMRAPIGAVGGPGKGAGAKNPLPPPSPPLTSSSTSLFSFSSLGAPAAAPVAKAGSSQPVRPTQTGGLSAQDLSFFEGL